MESSSTVSRRRPPSHMRDGHPTEPDKAFLVKRYRDGSRERAHILSDDEDIPTTKGEKYRRKKKHSSSSVNPPSSSGPRQGLSTDTYAERLTKSSRQKQGTSRSFTDIPTTAARPMPRGRKEGSRDGKSSSAKAPSAVAVSDDEVGSQPSYSGPIAAMEFNRMRRELESLKKVCPPSFMIYATAHGTLQQSTAYTKTIEKQASVGESFPTSSLPDIRIRQSCLCKTSYVQFSGYAPPAIIMRLGSRTILFTDSQGTSI